MDFIIPTVKVKSDHPRGYRIINASDFDPKKHEKLSEADEAKLAAVKPAAVVPAGEVVIPENWQGMKWSDKAALAKQIDPGFKVDPKDRVGSSEAVIVAELKRRAEAKA